MGKDVKPLPVPPPIPPSPVPVEPVPDMTPGAVPNCGNCQNYMLVRGSTLGGTCRALPIPQPPKAPRDWCGLWTTKP